MEPKLAEKEKALELRQQGKSLGEISSILSVAKSSVSWWCRNIRLSKKTRSEIMSRCGNHTAGALANKVKRGKEILLLSDLAKKNFKRFDIRDLERLKDIGTIIYWCEGAKRGMRQVDFTNSDPKMVRIMMCWFRQIHHVPEEKFKVSIYYHGGQNENKMRRYWSKITGVPLNQFHKSIFKKEGTGHRKNILYYGTCKIRVCDCDLLHKILAWIAQFDYEGL